MIQQRVYVASSWRNVVYPGIVAAIRGMGHAVYDFRNPAPGNHGFNWKEVDATYGGGMVSADKWRELLAHPVAAQGYKFDIGALRECDVCVLVLPAGRSACYELGYAMGMGKKGVVLALQDETPDLMFREAALCGSMNDLFDYFQFAMHESDKRQLELVR